MPAADPRKLAAREAGSKTYNGNPCKHGHTLRYLRGNCVACAKADAAKFDPEKRKEYRQKWKELNPEKVAARRKIDNAKRDPEKLRQDARAHRNRDPEKANRRTAAWRAANPGSGKRTYWANHETSKAKGRTLRRQRRARVLGAAGWHSIRHTEAILSAQGGRCSYCDVEDGLHLDHVVALVNGGSNWPWNLQWLCAHHNQSKNARSDSEYRAILQIPFDEPASVTIWRTFFEVHFLPLPSEILAFKRPK